MLRNLYALLALLTVRETSARKWNNTGKGTIAMEEGWVIPGQLQDLFVNGLPAAAGSSLAQYVPQLLDIHGRVSVMDATGIDYMILSCITPGIRGITNPFDAETVARQTNDKLAAAIANDTMRFGAFGAISMHNPTAAAAELERVVKKHGFLGALINDYQETLNGTLLYYDQPQYDVFWTKAQELNVPIYLHPRFAVPQRLGQYQHAIWLDGTSQEFTVSVSTHLLGICANGVFDRFPKLKLIVGHLGERIPSDLIRIDSAIQSSNIPMNRTIAYYFKNNIWETTSTNFASDLVEFHKKTIGIDRIMYSIDYPFAPLAAGQAWSMEILPRVSTAPSFLKLSGKQPLTSWA
ncbi:hypothetical protein M422DRAFT_785500 [Sphaerobolus stellatus SS14]|uniref:Amidohydrolase-related domain-containing protein n=1 Tax=Sphaerobolus stellatus (strain SS14) TaxID=990650 RepID=A0A0C9U9A8_SPHS4|nr:hypothetical protein M422DRAFT_785500 [Sphaerobolus stellatus SS14]